MIKTIFRIALLVCCIAFQPVKVSAQIPILDLIKGAAKKVIKAIDLKIQRQQNKVIWLQNAQKVLENEMSKLKLDQITDWTDKQKELYQKYFDELKKVKSIISYYQRIKEITNKQSRLIKEYNHAWGLLRNDSHFTLKEIEYMSSVYSGILGETLKNIDQIMLVANSFKTQMTDAKRIEIINAAAEKMEQNYADLQVFNNQNAMLSLSRGKSAEEIAVIKKMYGLQ
ncbi:conjugal transfer protein TraI [Pedobacter sp. GR22-10]|uniref:conjugal transfer protein TraI n=1 Tax=Pedobacter sp. GR22-10 TaxID=2994472 RepID=UPI0022486CFB|nr:conjugal transfer protein TraI [Pedobacter sp. GR22-10]MCX2429918.1 conjugal transfer protein TraI [Pedobacter sp. GR22-10]